MSSDDVGGFENVRQEVDGHPMLGLLGYARRYWGRLAAGIGSSILTRLARLVPPIVVAAAIDRVINQSGDPGPLADVGLVPVEPLATEAARLELLRALAMIAVIAYLARSVTRFGSRYLLQSTAQKIQRDLRDDTYDHMQHLSLDFFANHQTGATMSILNNDINRLEQFLSTEIRQIIRVVATVGGIGLVLLWVSPPLALIVLLPVPIIGLASMKFLTWIEPKYKRIRETVARLNSRLENNIGGAKVIKAFDRYEFELDRVAEQSQVYHDEQVAAIRLRRAFFASIRVLTGLAFVGILVVGGEMILSGRETFRVGPLVATTITAGTFATFFLYLRRMYSPLRRIGLTANRYQRAKSSAERVFGVLGHDPTITPPDDPHEPEAVDGRVTVDDVTFSSGTTDPVLEGIDLPVEPGETIGLAGETGAGKSTLVKLVPRFYDVDEGAVLVDGTDVREYGLQALRDHVGVVEQDPYLFSGTVEENVAYGDLSAMSGETEPIDDRIVAATEAADAGIEVRASINELVSSLETPRTIWIMVSHKAVDAVLDELVPQLDTGDTVIDGGNSHYTETVARATRLGEQGINFVDVGVSGGPGGARNGACMMIGGEREQFERLEPLFTVLNVEGGYGYMGKSGAGHFVKMVHNGIEYGMMQAIAEGFDIMRQSEFELDLAEIARVFANGSVIESRLIDDMYGAYTQWGNELEDVSGSAHASGEAGWTVKAAEELGVPRAVIADALEARYASQENPTYQGKVIMALRNKFGGHDLEQGEDQ